MVFAPQGLLASEASLCESYRQKASQLGCTDDNYLISFGYHYCLSFLEIQNDFSAQGAETFTKIRSCLVDTLEKAPGLTCENVQDVAEKSHVDCYVQSGFCQLGRSDRWAVFRIVWRELAFNARFWEVSKAISHACAK